MKLISVEGEEFLFALDKHNSWSLNDSLPWKNDVSFLLNVIQQIGVGDAVIL